ncbi:hypothetical protein [Yersinia massiliensis]|uniref:hypothetical protein n=1 Tax=Yersinia massiliensis TaxID=419257 RepID=UPI0025AB057A|nr:hypothetical protein [Yersinia massiliensis]MDN0127449.1 hypothetical protein [Yersinia massiliensis]
MNNIEERIEFLKASVALSDLIGPDELTVSVSDLSALIAQLEAAQKESDVYAKLASDVGDIITLLQNNEWAEHIGKTNVGGLLEYQITRLMNSIADINTKLLAAEAALSAANERLSKPVVLPPRKSASCFVDEEFSNADLAVIYNAARLEFSVKIKNSGFMVEE